MTIEPNNARRDVVVQTGGAALGWLIGLATGNPFGAVLGGGIGAATTPAMTYFLEKARGEWTHRGAVVANAASQVSGMSASEIIDHALQSDDLHPLVSRIIEAARQTGDIRQLRAMGYLLGRAARDNRAKHIDEDILIVSGLGELEPAGIRVLEILEHPFPSDDEKNMRWTSDRVMAAAGSELSPVGVHAALGGLIRHGLVETLPLVGGIGYDLTEYGRSMLSALRALA